MEALLKLVPNPTAKQEARDSVIRLLVETLEQANRGEVEAVLMIIKRADGNWANLSSGTTKFPDAIGYIEVAKVDWIKDYLDGQK